jgi:hypothetical protein
MRRERCRRCGLTICQVGNAAPSPTTIQFSSGMLRLTAFEAVWQIASVAQPTAGARCCSYSSPTIGQLIDMCPPSPVGGFE